MIRDVVSVRDKTRIHFRRLGQGPRMVLLHGDPQTGHVWRKVMPAFVVLWGEAGGRRPRVPDMGA
jgi:pimeloyl-ACP methyl ester carboxylesterase